DKEHGTSMTNTQMSLLNLGNHPEVGHLASPQSLWAQLEQWAASSRQLFIKKLSRNDTSWADDKGKHQAGFYVPRTIRESDFFPALEADNPQKPHIFHAACHVLWPQTGEVTTSHMRHYSNKGPESHFTGVPH